MSHTEKPIWGAPERNKDPILQVLKKHVAHKHFALEIGSGTGQHAVHFAQNLPQLHWQCSDQLEYIDGISQWVKEARLANLPAPKVFNVTAPMPDFSSNANPSGKFDIIYTANTLHIMSWQTVQELFALLPKLLSKNGMLMIYGPFNYEDNFTSTSNANFDATLKQRDPKMGIRDIADVAILAQKIGLSLIEDNEMPANNRFLIFNQGA